VLTIGFVVAPANAEAERTVSIDGELSLLRNEVPPAVLSMGIEQMSVGSTVVVPNGTYSFIPIDARGNLVGNRAMHGQRVAPSVQLSTRSPGSLNQRWHVQRRSDGWYYIFANVPGVSASGMYLITQSDGRGSVAWAGASSAIGQQRAHWQFIRSPNGIGLANRIISTGRLAHRNVTITGAQLHIDSPMEWSGREWRLPELSLNQINLTYDFIRNTGFPSTGNSTPQAIMDNVKPAFQQLYRIDLRRGTGLSTSALNQRSGCTRPNNIGCNATCAPVSQCIARHHRASHHFIGVLPGTRNRLAFRFVDYGLCAANAGHVDNVGGVANRLGNDMIITIARGSAAARRFAAHEISHIFGAWDGFCTPGQTCVMNESPRYYLWCNNCASHIRALRNR